MLSRGADSLYWIGRYIERAENVTRLLLVASDASVELEGLDEALAQREWDELLSSVPGSQRARLEFSPAAGLAVPYINALLLDPGNPVSVTHSLAMARENVRSVREALTREVFVHVNEAHRGLDKLRRRGVQDPALALDLLARTHTAILATLGAIEHTLSRDEGWTFMKLGEAFERTLRTLLVLKAKAAQVADDKPAGEGADLPLFYARWRGVLRSVASLENYRRVQGADLDPMRVVRFLLFDASTPRAVRCGLMRMQNYLHQLPGGSATSAAKRIVGRLLATVTYDDDELLARQGLLGFCEEAAAELQKAHEAIALQYFPV